MLRIAQPSTDAERVPWCGIEKGAHSADRTGLDQPMDNGGVAGKRERDPLDAPLRTSASVGGVPRNLVRGRALVTHVPGLDVPHVPGTSPLAAKRDDLDPRMT
jgi:hypothetical protein